MRSSCRRSPCLCAKTLALLTSCWRHCFKQIADDYQQALRDVVAYAVQNGIPVPTFSAAIAYYDSYRSAVLPANLIQAQRDYFGAHTYKRTDKEGVFHTEWLD